MHHKTNDAHTQLCDWQRLFHSSTLKLSENRKRFCVSVCVYLWNFPQRKTHWGKKKPHWKRTHVHLVHIYLYSTFVVVYAAVTTRTSTATAKLPLFMFHDACLLVSWRRRVDVATSRRHLSFPSISNTSNCNIATKSVSRVFVLALSLLSLALICWVRVVWWRVPFEWAKLRKEQKKKKEKKIEAKIEVFESKRRNKNKKIAFAVVCLGVTEGAFVCWKSMFQSC